MGRLGQRTRLRTFFCCPSLLVATRRRTHRDPPPASQSVIHRLRVDLFANSRHTLFANGSHTTTRAVIHCSNSECELEETPLVCLQTVLSLFANGSWLFANGGRQFTHAVCKRQPAVCKQPKTVFKPFCSQVLGQCSKLGSVWQVIGQVFPGAGMGDRCELAASLYANSRTAHRHAVCKRSDGALTICLLGLMATCLACCSAAAT